ncbi:ISAs1 family transposase [Chromobacterium amazonense]|uniref:ISAs1 family transposase n=1 Tax=Chromobacterium amazonense TaxID=1382803 RepID=A0ABU8V6Z4_9NEIS|nr:ISAs1 family transposase [Chromobacterium amazonense]MDQ4539507.1 ISAs1 family transposase [Chromobacterium amazonense]
MPCTAKKTLQIAQKSGSDVLVQVKRNQPKLHEQLLEFATSDAAAELCVTQDVGRRNRIEQRQTRVWHLPEGVLAEDWSVLRTLICVERNVERFDVRHQQWRPSQDAAWYVCTRQLRAVQASQLVRGHWGIENRCHYVRDVTLNEDASQIRVNPGVFAQLRSWALNCLRRAGHRNIKAARERLGWETDQLLPMFKLAAPAG